MCSFRKSLLWPLVLYIILGGAARAAAYVDVLELPARPSELAVRSPLLDVTQAGSRLVSVGQRGHILYSDDTGQTWKQAQVPVSVDLNAVHFPTAQQGWAVGNDGVILHTSDAGQSWSKQLDGRQIGDLLIDHYGARASAEPENEQWPLLVAEGERLKAEGADKPFLDVWFESERSGYVVGVFNLILATTDGGQTWTPWQDRTDNPQGLNLFAIDNTGDALYLVGEQGLVRRLDQGTQTFDRIETPYQGSFFGVTGQHGEVLVYGLRGNVLRSLDRGASWQTLQSDLEVSFTAATNGPHGSYRLFTQAGHQLLAEPGARKLRLLPLSEPAPIAGALQTTEGPLILVGNRGVRRLSAE